MFTLQVLQLPAYNVDISSHSVTPWGPYTISYRHFRCVNTRQSWSSIYSGSRLPLLTWSATKRTCRSACKLYYDNMHGVSANIHRVSANTHGVSAIMQLVFKQHFGLMWTVSMSMATSVALQSWRVSPQLSWHTPSSKLHIHYHFCASQQKSSVCIKEAVHAATSRVWQI